MNISYRVNSPHIVHETIDGETIIMDLRTGNYYSIEWPGTLIWEFIAKAGNLDGLMHCLSNEEGLSRDAISGLQTFITSMVKEELLVEFSGEGAISEIPDNIRQEIKKVAQNFKTPELNKYTDMQDMLLLDPIHDVDEKGWPEPKKKNG